MGAFCLSDEPERAGLMAEIERLTQVVENLQVALDRRDVIGQAKGILMHRDHLTADRAFEVLVEVSSLTHIKVYEIADDLIRTGELPQM